MERYFEDIERYKALFTKRGESYCIEDGVIFKFYQKMIVHQGAIKRDSNIRKNKQ